MIRTWATARLLFPAHERIMGRPTFDMLRQLLANRDLSADGLMALRTKKLRALLVHACEKVPFYRDQIARIGCDPQHDDPWQVLAAFPLVDRTDIRDNLEAFRASTSGKLRLDSTSGSTGQPLKFYVDVKRMASDKAVRLRAQLDWGVGVGDRKAWLWGVSPDAGWTGRIKNLRDRLMNEVAFNAYSMTPSRMRRYLHDLVRLRPRCVTCYPSAAWQLCSFAEEEKFDLVSAGVSRWFCTGEMLDERFRRVIEQAAGGRVANEYGMREGGLVAHECPSGTMHVIPETIIAETIGSDQGLAQQQSPKAQAQKEDVRRAVVENQVRELVVTNLDGLGMPMIRYRTHDFCRLREASCPCGWPTQTLHNLAGRRGDFLIDVNGTPHVSFALSRPFWSVPGVRQFQVVQESLDLTRVLVVGDSDFTEASREHVRRIFRGVLGTPVRVEIHQVDKISRRPSGKARVIQSKVSAKYL